MFYTIYKITNNLDGKYYIGKHQTKNLNDGYFGSGKVLKRAIKKHGIENFTKEILHVFDTEEKMNAKEKELVVLEESSYNLCSGGKGGWGYINNTKEIKAKSNKTRHIKNPNILRRAGKKGGKITQELYGISNKFSEAGKTSFLGKHHTEETKEKMRSKMKGRIPWNKGIARTEEEKEKIRQGISKYKNAGEV